MKPNVVLRRSRLRRIYTHLSIRQPDLQTSVHLPQFLIPRAFLVPRDYKSKHRAWARILDFSHR